MIEIDGRNGGGQLLRTALSLSVITQENFRIENIRQRRKQPGLKKQHLKAVEAAKRLSNADVRGDKVGSKEIVFKPGKYEAENFTVNIGTAGSVTLLLDTFIPITTQFNQKFRLTLKGGTNVKWSPTIEYWKHVKLDLLKKHGLNAELEIKRTGFYPKGNGKVVFNYKPSSIDKIEMKEKGDLEKIHIYSKCSKKLSKKNVAHRQADKAWKKIKKEFPSLETEKDVKTVKTDSPGSSLCIKGIYDYSLAGFDNLGEKGKRSEKVAEEAVDEFLEFHYSKSSVDKYLADQLMIFLALSGGKIGLEELTPHISSNKNIINKFNFDLEIRDKDKIYLNG